MIRRRRVGALAIDEGIIDLAPAVRHRSYDRVLDLQGKGIVGPYACDAHLHLTLPPTSSPFPNSAGNFPHARDWERVLDQKVNWDTIRATTKVSAGLNLKLSVLEGVGLVIGYGGKPEILKYAKTFGPNVALVANVTQVDLERMEERGKINLTRLDESTLEALFRGYIPGVHSFYRTNLDVARAVYDYARARDMPFVGHFGEGTDKYASEELHRLVDHELVRNTVLIHAVGFGRDRALVRRFAECRGVVWCLSSNLHLLGATTPVRDLLADGVRVAIGTDNGLCGTSSFSSEARAVLRYAKEHDIQATELYQMFFRAPYDMFGIAPPSDIDSGQPADLRVVQSSVALSSDSSIEEVILEFLTGRVLALFVGGRDVFRRYRRKAAWRRADAMFSQALASS